MIGDIGCIGDSGQERTNGDVAYSVIYQEVAVRPDKSVVRSCPLRTFALEASVGYQASRLQETVARAPCDG